MSKEQVVIEVLVNTIKGSQNISELKTNVKSLDKQIADTGTTTNKASGLIQGFGSKAKDSFNNATGGVNIFGKGIGSLFKMILTNPIGLLIGAVTLLINGLRKLDPVVDFLEQAFDALGAAFDAIIGSVGQFFAAIANGDGLVAAFSNSFGNLGTKIKEAATEASDLRKEIQQLEDVQNDFTVSSAKAEGAVKNLLIQAKNANLTYKEKKALLEQASALEKKNFQESLKIAEKEFEIASRQLALIDKAGKDRGEAAKAAADAEANLIRIKSSSADLQEKIENRLALLSEQQKSKQDAITQKKEADSKKLEEAEKKAIEDSKNRKQKEYDDSLKASENYFGQLELQIINSANSKEEKERELAALGLKRLQDKIQIEKDYKESTIADEIDLANKKIKLNEDIKKSDEELNKAKIKTAQEGLDGTANILSEASQLAEEGSEEQKALAIASTIIGTYSSAQKAFNSLAEIPVVGPVLGSIAAGIAVATGLQRVAKIQSTPVPKHEFGGILNGPSHRQGGIPTGLNAELEGNEIVLNRQVTYNPYLRNAASALNTATGGKDFSVPVPQSQANDRPILVNAYITESQVTQTQKRVERIKRTASI